MKKWICFFLTLSLLVTGAACTKVTRNRLQSVTELSGMAIGLIGGTQGETHASNIEAKGAIVTIYADTLQAVSALENATLDGVVLDAVTANLLQKDHKSIRILEDAYAYEELRAVTAKENASLAFALSQGIAALQEKGTLDKIVSHYVEGTEYSVSEPKGETGIRLAVAEQVPYAYRDEEGNLVGLNVDIAKAICAQLGISLTITTAEYDMLLEMVQKGRADFAMGAFTEGDAGEKAVEYTDPYMTCHQVVIVRKK